MDTPFSLTLKLDRPECLQGESLFFSAVLENVSGAQVRNVPTFEPTNHALRLIIEGPKLRRSGDALSADEREGVHRHGPTDTERRTLNPKATLSTRGDLLEWLGEIPPGTYQLRAHYDAMLLECESAPVTVTVRPASIIGSWTPRYGAQMPMARLTAAWAHHDEKEVMAFYQRLSAGLPRSTRRSLRLAGLGALHDVWPAAVATPAAEGHLLWRDTRDKLYFTAIDAETPKIGSPVEINVPFAGEPLASPLTLPGGGLILAWTDAKKNKVAVLRVARNGAASTRELDLEKRQPLGPYVCFWEYGARLHFAWAAAGGREVMVARLPLTDPAADFTARAAFQSDDPVVWLDAYVDLDAAFKDQPYFEEQLQEDQRDKLPETQPSPIYLWCVTTSGGRLTCHRVNVTDGQSKVEAGFSAPGGADLRVISSAVTHRHELSLLLADPQDQLYYASTAGGAILPLADAAKREITLDRAPTLLTASESGFEPWVYVRFVERKATIEYVRLEPDYQQDPIERGQ